MYKMENYDALARDRITNPHNIQHFSPQCYNKNRPTIFYFISIENFRFGICELSAMCHKKRKKRNIICIQLMALYI